MSVIEAINQKSKLLSPERQKELLDFAEFLTSKEQPNRLEETIRMNFAWAGGLKELNQTASEVQAEILRKRGEM
ncbi:MAG: DUF2281 domain-containing protein [Rhizobacter sp.]|nr:DUF2281 domain-containing protein [Chlorobiales bacterium]